MFRKCSIQKVYDSMHGIINFLNWTFSKHGQIKNFTLFSCKIFASFYWLRFLVVSRNFLFPMTEFNISFIHVEKYVRTVKTPLVYFKWAIHALYNTSFCFTFLYWTRRKSRIIRLSRTSWTQDPSPSLVVLQMTLWKQPNGWLYSE